MKAIPKHFKLIKEHPHFYEIVDERDGKKFQVAKKDLDLGMHARLSKIQRFDEGGQAQSNSDSSGSSDSSSDTPQTPVTVNVNASPQPLQQELAQPAPVVPVSGASNAQTPQERAPAGAQSTNAPESQTSAVPPTVATPPLPGKGSLTQQYGKSVATEQQGMADMANIEARQKAEEAKALQGVYGPQGQMEAIVKKFQDSSAQLDEENKNLTQAVIDQKIDPNRVIHDKSIAGKIGTAIGIILGGIGQGLQHSNTNAALETLKSQISNDIEAQKAELGKKTTLLSLNMQKYRNLDLATQATMQQMTAMVNGKMQLQAAQSGSPLAIARAKVASSQLQQQFILERPKLAEADTKLSALNELNGTSPTKSGGAKVLSPDSSGNLNSPLGKPGDINPSPTGRTGGIDLKKLNLYQQAGVISKEDAATATKEAGDFQEAQATKALLRKDLQEMQDAAKASPLGVGARRTQEVASKLPWLGPVVGEINPFGGEAGRRYAAAKASASNKINTLLTKRIGGEGMKNITLELPTGQESPEELTDKTKRIMDLIDTNSKTPTLDRYKLIR